MLLDFVDPGTREVDVKMMLCERLSMMRRYDVDALPQQIIHNGAISPVG